MADPLSRNGYALVVNSGVTGILGLAYWILVARLYPTEVVGRAAAAYAAMNLLAGFTALNFNGLLTRFIPQSGSNTRKLVTQAYLVSAAFSVAVAIPFLLTIHRWGPSYAELGSPVIGLFFIGAVVVWAVFTLQDSVLTGLRNAVWVLFENGLFGVIKIVLLVLFAASLTHLGIYLSWMLPALLAVPLVNALIYRRLVPRHAEATLDCVPPTNRQMGRFLAGDYSGSAFLLATTNLVPVLVAVRIADVRLTAYFYMAWMVGGVLDLVGVNMSMSLTVEGAFDASTLAANCRKALRKIACDPPPVRGAGGPARAPGTAPVRAGLCRVRCAGPRTARCGDAAPGADRGLPGRAPRPEPDLRGRDHPGDPLRPDAGTHRRPGHCHGAGRRRAGRGHQPGPGGPADHPGPLAHPGGQPEAGRRAGRGGWHPGGQRAMTSQTEKTIALGRPGLLSGGPIRWPTVPAAAIGALGLAGFVLFFASLRHVHLSHMNGLGLLSVLPHGAVAGVIILALAFVLGIALPRPHPLGLAAGLVALVICLDGVTTFIEPQPRFPTAFQIAGFIQYISSTGHATPGLAAYFSWPGFFALVSMVTGAAGTHGLLGLMRVWPMLIDLACLPPFFLIMRNLRIPWRAQWVAGFLFTVGNWVGQDYLSPQSFNYVLYLVFLAILVNWFTQPRLSASPRVIVSGLTRLHRRIFGILRPGELAPRPASTGQRAFLLAVLIAIFAVSTMSHQLTPFYLVGACHGAGARAAEHPARAAGPVRRHPDRLGQLRSRGLLVRPHVQHLRRLRQPRRQPDQQRRRPADGQHLRPPAHAARPGRRGRGDRGNGHPRAAPPQAEGVRRPRPDRPVLHAHPLDRAAELWRRDGAADLSLPAPGRLHPGGLLLLRRPEGGRANWRAIPVLALCAAILPVAFILVRYGNDAFEQIPTGEVAASNWIYSHDAQGARIQWLSSSPTIDNTPEMPWSYKDINKVLYLPVQAPLHPADVSGLVRGLRSSGPGTYLIATRTQETYLEQAAGYPAGWGSHFNQLMRAEPGVRVAFTNSAATVYTVALAARRPPAAAAAERGTGLPDHDRERARPGPAVHADRRAHGTRVPPGRPAAGHAAHPSAHRGLRAVAGARAR